MREEQEKKIDIVNRTNFSQTKKRKTIILAIVVLIVLVGLVTINNSRILNKVFDIQINKETIPLLSYIVYDNQDEQNIKGILTVSSEKEIEYIEYSNGQRIYGNGKNTISIDYITSKNSKYIFNIKEIGQNEKREEITITDQIIEETLKIEKISDNTGYKTIEISENMDLKGFKTYYKIGKDSTQWVEGKGRISILDYDVTTNGLINQEDETITILAMVRNEDTGDTVLISREYDVDVNSKIDSFEADSLLNAMEKYDFGTGKYKVKVSDEIYNLKVYAFDENQEIITNTQLGTEEDVGASNKYAENMIVLKVNGDLTIEEGATLTAYASKTGHGGPKGMMIYCTGTLTNNGTVSMTARGAYAEGQNVYLWKNTDGSYETVPAVGARGADVVSSSYVNGIKGNNAINRQTAGGGSGASYRGVSGAGSAGTSYSGGTGRWRFKRRNCYTRF